MGHTVSEKDGFARQAKPQHVWLTSTNQRIPLLPDTAPNPFGPDLVFSLPRIVSLPTLIRRSWCLRDHPGIYKYKLLFTKRYTQNTFNLKKNVVITLVTLHTIPLLNIVPANCRAFVLCWQIPPSSHYQVTWLLTFLPTSPPPPQVGSAYWPPLPGLG